MQSLAPGGPGLFCLDGAWNPPPLLIFCVSGNLTFHCLNNDRKRSRNIHCEKEKILTGSLKKGQNCGENWTLRKCGSEVAPGIWGQHERKKGCEPERRDESCIQMCVRNWTRWKIMGRWGQWNQKTNIRGSEERIETSQVLWKIVQQITFRTSKCSSSSQQVFLEQDLNGWMDGWEMREGDHFNYITDYFCSLAVWLTLIKNCCSRILH